MRGKQPRMLSALVMMLNPGPPEKGNPAPAYTHFPALHARIRPRLRSTPSQPLPQAEHHSLCMTVSLSSCFWHSVEGLGQVLAR